MSDKLAEAQRKAAQGSQQLQGEVLEVLLEDQLREAFPFDTIEEVKKGARGGDVIQRVMTRAGQLAGSILWEAKRTTTWVKDWTAKLKDDPEGGRRGGWRHCQCDSPEGVCARTAVRTL